MKIDLSQYHILIATPSHDGKYDSAFVNSLEETKKLITSHGGKIGFLECKYCADIYYARAALVGAFHRFKEATHLMFIDADMGWDAQDVLRMILLNTDLIAGAGPRKSYPTNVISNFAFALRDDNNNPIPLYHTIETSVGEVSEVGGAFVMISRNCIERMINAYPELAFNSSEHVTDYALFEPIIINNGDEHTKRRLSEDYAFCYRWRKIGGKVEVLLDVKLKHVGSHTFEGRLIDALNAQSPDFAENNSGEESNH